MSRIAYLDTSRLSNFLSFNKDPLHFLLEVLPKGEVIDLKTGVKPSYIVNSPDFIKDILVTKQTSFVKGRTSHVLRRTIGDGLLTTEGNEHKRQKRYYQPVFHKERLDNYAYTIVEETRAMANSWSSGSTISLSDAMMQLTLSIITKTMFCTDVEETKTRLASAVKVTIEQSAKSLFSPILFPMMVPTKGHRVHKQAIETLETMIYETLNDAKNHPERYHNSMLGMLLDTQDDLGHPISDQEIRDQMMTMLLAGHETTANLLTWIFYLLSQNPEVEEKWQMELDTISNLSLAPIELYKELPYTQLIIKEALRLYPPAWLIYREAQEPVTLLGHPFPKKSSFMICPYALHRNPIYFENPEAFRPERFLEKQAEAWPAFAYFPFGGGSRGCVGSRFALIEAALIMTTIGSHYKFRVVGNHPVTPDPLISLRVKEGLNMTVLRRSL